MLSPHAVKFKLTALGNVPTNTALKLPMSDSGSLPSPVPVKKGPDKAWAAPPTGWVKLTIDGLFQASDRTAGLGMVLCNEEDGATLLSRILSRLANVALMLL
jgi:hypothetical protein